MGSLLLARKEDSTSFSIIDGQQRLTTSYIFLKLLVDFSKKYGTDEEQFYIKSSLCKGTSKGYKYKITFLYEQTKKLMNDFVKQDSLENTKSFITSVQNSTNCSESEKRMLNAYQHFLELLNAEFSKEGMADWPAIYDFASYFLEHVIFSVIYTENTQEALVLFQNMNDRGVSLTKTDLLKNLLLQHLKANDLEEKETYLSNKWREFIETIDTSKNMTITPDRFLRYYIMVKTGRSGI